MRLKCLAIGLNLSYIRPSDRWLLSSPPTTTSLPVSSPFTSLPTKSHIQCASLLLPPFLPFWLSLALALPLLLLPRVSHIARARLPKLNPTTTDTYLALATTTPPPPDCGSSTSDGSVAHWGQCGGEHNLTMTRISWRNSIPLMTGTNWKGGKVCVKPYTCKEQNEWYSQCL